MPPLRAVAFRCRLELANPLGAVAVAFRCRPERAKRRGISLQAFIQATNAEYRHFFFFPVPFSDDEPFEVSELFDVSEDFDSLGFESPDFSLAFEPSLELSEDELSGFFPA